MLETYADRPLTTQLTVKRGFVHFEIGASADLKMDKAESNRDNNIRKAGMINRRLKFRSLRLLVVIGLSAVFLPNLRDFSRSFAQTQPTNPPIPLGLPADTWDHY